MNRLQHSYSQKSFIIIDSLFLSKPFCDKPCFKSFHFAIYSSFFLIDLLASDRFYLFGWFFKIPNLIRVYRLHLRYHNLLPKFCNFILHWLIVVERISILFIMDLVKRFSQEHVHIRLSYNPTLRRDTLYDCVSIIAFCAGFKPDSGSSSH